MTSTGFNTYDGDEIKYSYVLNPAGFISEVSVYYPSSVCSSSAPSEARTALASVFAGKGAKTAESQSSAAKDFNYIDFFTVENARCLLVKDN